MMEWEVTDKLGFVFAQFRYAVDALQYKKYTEESQEFLVIRKIGEQ